MVNNSIHLLFNMVLTLYNFLLGLNTVVHNILQFPHEIYNIYVKILAYRYHF